MATRYPYRKNATKMQKARARQRKKTHNMRKRVARLRHEDKFENGQRQKRTRKQRFLHDSRPRAIVYKTAKPDIFGIWPVFRRLPKHHQANMHPVRYRAG